MEAATSVRESSAWPSLKDPSLVAAFQRTAAENADRVALRTPDGAVELTYGEYAERARRIAAGLAASGVSPGDVVGLMLTNSVEFHLVDTAVLHLGAATVSVYNTFPADEIEYVMDHAGPRVFVTEPAFADRVLEAAGRVDAVETVVMAEGEADGAITLAELEARGSGDFDFEGAWRAVTEDNLATLIYTSGTTGQPKGVQHTHSTMLYALGSFQYLAPISPEGRVVSFLPCAHIAERLISHYPAMTFGYTITCCRDPKEVGKAFASARPTRLFAVPRIYEKFMQALKGGIAGQEDPQTKQAMEAALETGLKKVRAEQAEEPISDELAAEYEQADEQVFAKLRAQVGLDQLEWVAVAAAPTPYHVLEFWHAIGVPIAELWGMSENCLCVSNPPERIKLGTVGYALPGVEIDLAEDGEILVRGPNVTPGYFRDPEKTAAAFDDDGWFYSGDIASRDEDGYLTIVDRKKELIVNSSGKNMSPANIEERIKESSPLIGQAICIGDGRQFNVALLVLDPDAASSWAKQNGIDGASTEEVAADERVRKAVAEGIEQANGKLARVEQIKYHELLHEEWLPGGDELTPTSKLKRKPIAQKYEPQIEALYEAGAGYSR